MGVILMGVCELVLAWGPGGAVSLADEKEGRYRGKQGQILVVKVPAEGDVCEAKGTFGGRTIRFFPEAGKNGQKELVGLLGIDMEDKPGVYDLTIEVTDGEQTRALRYEVEVLKEKFRVERLTLPKDKVDLDEKSLQRWKTEQEQVRAALAEDSPARLWRAGFVEPVSGRRTGIFGSVRIMNGQARSPHNGEDIGAPIGTPVVVTNDGVVRLTVDHLFSGKGVYVDHGLGFYSMYFHLSEILVKEGDPVRAGQVIGKVGASGRATGPHLHWGVKLNGARVNPYALLDLPFKGEVRATVQSPAADQPTAVGEPAP
ncbi:MAG: M23 family metallopeptidase [Nitrospira sp.]|nr:M23 family metallopeptidase [Nitrospira sp.]